MITNTKLNTPKLNPQRNDARRNFVKKQSDLSFGNFYTHKATRGAVKAVSKVYNSSGGAVLETLYALILTTFFRPVAIMLTPGSEKRDKQYAAAHSMAAGFVNFGLTWAAFQPISNANKKVLEELEPIVEKNRLAQGFDKLLKKTKSFIPDNEWIKSAFNEGRVQKIKDKDKLHRLFSPKILHEELEELDDILRKNNCKEDHTRIYQELAERKDPVRKFRKLDRTYNSLKIAAKEESKLINGLKRYLVNPKRFDMYKSLTTNGVRIFFLPIIGISTVGIISPIVKKVFPKPKKENNLNNTIFASSVFKNDAFKHFVERMEHVNN